MYLVERQEMSKQYFSFAETCAYIVQMLLFVTEAA